MLNLLLSIGAIVLIGVGILHLIRRAWIWGLALIGAGVLVLAAFPAHPTLAL